MGAARHLGGDGAWAGPEGGASPHLEQKLGCHVKGPTEGGPCGGARGPSGAEQIAQTESGQFSPGLKWGIGNTVPSEAALSANANPFLLHLPWRQ